MSEIIKYEEKSLLPPAGEWATMMQMATVLQKSGLLPEAVNTPEKAVTIMLKGRELGIPPMQAFASINVIKGKPSLSSDLMSSLVRSHGHSIRIVESTDKRCEVTGKRKDTGDSYTSVFTHEMAVKAQLPGQNQNYGKYPENMLRARAISNLCRVLFSDIIMGMYTPEEVEEFGDTKTIEVSKDTEIYNVRMPSEPRGKARQEVVDTSTGEIVEQPKRGKKMSDMEIFEQGRIAKYIWETTGLETVPKGNHVFANITLDQFGGAVKGITGTNNSVEALKKYGIQGTLNDILKAKYKGEGLSMGQMLSAGLHYLWEQEQLHQDKLDTVGELVPAGVTVKADEQESEGLNFGF